MKIGILGDTHFNNKSPERRIDDYWDTQKSKLKQALKIFKGSGCQLVIQTGDFTDNPHVSNIVISELLNILNEYKDDFTFYGIAGQHDLIGHNISTINSSPLSVFMACHLCEFLGRIPCAEYNLKSGWDFENGYHLYGASFGQDIPEVTKKENYNILVIHRMIGDRQLYPEQELAEPRQFLRDYPHFHLVICGDYHYRYIDSYQGRTILNPGALMRKTISKFDLEHRPAVIVFDTATNKAEVIELDFMPTEQVFDFSDKVKTTDYSSLTKFIDAVKNRGTEFTGWKSVLHDVLKEREASEEAGTVIDECLEEIKNSE